MSDVIDLAAYRRRREQDLEDDRRLAASSPAIEGIAKLMLRLAPNGDVELEALSGAYTFAFPADLAVAIGEVMIKLGMKSLGEPWPRG